MSRYWISMTELNLYIILSPNIKLVKHQNYTDLLKSKSYLVSRQIFSLIPHYLVRVAAVWKLKILSNIITNYDILKILFTLQFFTKHHHHHDVRLARISLTLSLHVSLSFIAFGRSSGLHPVSSHSCCMNVRAGRPAFDWPYVGVHKSTSLTISSLLLPQCPACLVRLACIVFVIGGRWPYSWRRVECCFQDLFNIAHNILV